MKLDDNLLDTLEEYGPIARTLSMCLRPTFCAERDDATLVWGDWASIEARVLPWLANSDGGQEVLNVFENVDADPDAADIYMIEAANIHGTTPEEVQARIRDKDPEAKGWRQEGKVAVLSLGFGGGVGALMAMATGYGLHFEEEKAKHIVGTWRENNRWAVRFWEELNEAFFSAYASPDTVFEAGRLSYVYNRDYHGGSIFCALPCGRLLTYPHLKYRTVTKTNKQTGEEYTTEAMTYRKGYSWGTLWHGILSENPTQAVAASVLRAKLRRLDAKTHAGGEIAVRGHTHDEIILECADSKETVAWACQTLNEVMNEPLDWTEGLPLASEVQTNWFYTKAID